MLETFKNVIENFVLFGFIEGFVIVYFYTKINDLEINLKTISLISFTLGLFNTIMKYAFFLPPLLFQLMVLLYMSLILTYIHKIKPFQSIISILKILLIMLVIEIIPAIIAKFVFKIDLLSMTNMERFMWLIPARVIELGVVIYYYQVKEVFKNGLNLGWRHQKKVIKK